MENKPSPAPLHHVVGQLRELHEKATYGRWEHIRRDMTLDAIYCLGEPVAVRLYAADAALIVATVTNLPSMLDIIELADAAMYLRNNGDPHGQMGRVFDQLTHALSLLPNPEVSGPPSGGSTAPRC